MAKRVGGYRRKSRYKFRKAAREKGKVAITRYLKDFNVGDRVVLNAEPSYHKGLFHSRYQGRSGVIVGKRGKCYNVLIKETSKEKMFIVHPVHLERA